MDIVIFPTSQNDWWFATPATEDRAVAPVNIGGAVITYRLWADPALPEHQWQDAKDFFIRLSGKLSIGLAA